MELKKSCRDLRMILEILGCVGYILEINMEIDAVIFLVSVSI